MFSRELVYNMSEAVSYELRAFYNDDIRRGVRGKSGLSCFSPVINIMRHPLWGRNQVSIFTLPSELHIIQYCSSAVCVSLTAWLVGSCVGICYYWLLCEKMHSLNKKYWWKLHLRGMHDCAKVDFDKGRSCEYLQSCRLIYCVYVFNFVLGLVSAGSIISLSRLVVCAYVCVSGAFYAKMAQLVASKFCKWALV